MEFQRYPMEMKHPRAQAAVTSGPLRDERGRVIGQQPAGKPATFPPVTVNNKDQELLYASKGYLPAGNSDPEAYMRAVVGADAPQVYNFTEYPKWLYRITDDELESKLVKSADDEKKLGNGWHKTPDLARTAVEVATEADEELVASTDHGAAGAVPVKTRRPYKRRKYKKRAKPEMDSPQSGPVA